LKRFVACALPVLLLLAWLPQVLTRDLLTFLFFTYVFMVLAANYDLLGGFLRYMNLGQGAFFGLAAYVFAVLLQHFPAFFLRLQPLGVPVAALAAVVVTAGFAFVVSYPLFRLRGAYFAVVTFGLVLALQQAVLRTPALTGGSLGVTLPPQFYVDIHQAYYPALLLAFLAVLLNFAVSRSRLGLALHTIRDNEQTAAAIGVDPFRYKRLALVLASLPSAAVGCLFALFLGHLYVETVLGMEKTLLPVIIALVGGSGHFLGPVVGGMVVQGIDLGLRYGALPVPALAIFGLLLMVIGLFLPGGLLSVLPRQPPWR
jgi:branched-chain amino acid transport system permease protein